MRVNHLLFSADVSLCLIREVMDGYCGCGLGALDHSKGAQHVAKMVPKHRQIEFRCHVSIG